MNHGEIIKQFSSKIGSHIIDSEVQKHWAERRNVTTPERQKSMDLVEGIIAKNLKNAMANYSNLS